MYWFDGQIRDSLTLTVAIDHPGLLYGATVFTTLRVYGGSLDHRLTAWQGHCDRIQATLQTFDWPRPNWSQVRRGAEGLARHYPILRLTLWPDGRELITGRELPPDLAERQTQGIAAWVAPADYGRSLPGHKTGNYLACWLAGQAAQDQGAAEAILVDGAGNWLETSTGNLWGWCDGAWWTPPLTEGILPGLVRSHLITHLTALDHPVVAVPWTCQQVKRFACLAYSNSVVELVPVHTVQQGRTRLEYNPDHAAFELLRRHWHGSQSSKRLLDQF